MDPNQEKRQDPLNPGVDPVNFGVAHEQDKERVETQTKQVEEKAATDSANIKEVKYRKVGIRTYRDYASEELRKGGATLTKMIISEREKEREQKRHSIKNKKNIAVTLVAGVFFVVGAGIVVLSFFLVSQKQAELQEKASIIVVPDPIIINDFRQEIYIQEPTRAKVVREFTREIDETTIPAGAIKHLYITQDNKAGKKELTKTADLFTYLQARPPGVFLRALDSNFMYGIYSTTENSPFFIFKVASYIDGYSGMLDWEDTVVRDMEAVFGKNYDDIARSAFEDIVLYNTDVRAILDVKGEPVFGYAFLQDKATLVIFNNKLTLREIISRMQQNTVRQ